MKKSLVLEIQTLAIEAQNDISDLLRKALFAATKLGLDDFKDWVNKELNGYREGEVPEYRKTRATISFKNPYHGLIPVHFGSEEIADAFCECDIRDPIGNIVSILSKRDDSKSGPIYPLTQKQEQFLISQQDGLQLPPVRTISIDALATIVDVVRTKILEWSLKLEQEGILGEGMTFSKEEKELAMKSHDINIQNFQGILGNVDNSSVTQHLDMRITKNDLESLKKYLLSVGIQNTDISELQRAIADDGQPKSSGGLGSKVSDWMGKMIAKAASGSWQVGVGAAGNLLSKAISLYYGI
jgi:hypothetical protein